MFRHCFEEMLWMMYQFVWNKINKHSGFDDIVKTLSGSRDHREKPHSKDINDVCILTTPVIFFLIALLIWSSNILYNHEAPPCRETSTLSMVALQSLVPIVGRPCSSTPVENCLRTALNVFRKIDC